MDIFLKKKQVINNYAYYQIVEVCNMKNIKLSKGIYRHKLKKNSNGNFSIRILFNRFGTFENS